MKKSTFVLFGALTLSMGCTTFKEHHFFKDKTSPNPNYYKVSINGHAIFYSKTRYYSGYFSEEAIAEYFNEFSQPKNGMLHKKDTGDIVPIGASPDKKLVMILSSNADDIANQIGSMDKMRETFQSINSLSNQDNFEQYIALETELHTLNATVERRKQEEEILINSLSENDDKEKVKQVLLQYLNRLAFELGNRNPFENFNHAKKWFESNQSK